MLEISPSPAPSHLCEQVLLRMGASVHAREKNGYTALTLAVLCDRVYAGLWDREGQGWLVWWL